MTNLEKARLAKTTKQLEDIYQKAVRLYRGHNAAVDLNEYYFKQRLSDVAMTEGISLNKAWKLFQRLASFASREQIYKNAVLDAITAGQKKHVRALIAHWEAEVIGEKVKWNQVEFDLNTFHYDNTLQALVHVSNRILIRIVEGQDSTSPSFLEIAEI